jgi:tripartite-type tricarboxylate transporter receptor subunit TctC
MKKNILSFFLAVATPFSVYANKDIDLKISVPNPPGGGQDVVARIVATGASTLGYNVIVENKPGAGGITGTNECIKRTATEKNLLCLVSQAQAVVMPPDLESFVQYKFEDLKSVKLLATSPMVMITSTKNSKTYNEIIDEFKANKQLNLGSAAWLNTQHNNHFLKGLGNTKSQVVDYKGANQIIIDIVNGSLDYAFVPYSSVIGLYAGGTIRIAAVCNPRLKIDALKNIPTLAIKDGWTEENYADFGLVSGPMTKNEDILVLEKIITETLKDRTVRENLTKIGIVASDMSSFDYRNLQTEQKNRYIRLIKK